jgi:thiosulfate dehydrogenase (quinone) large subunit
VSLIAQRDDRALPSVEQARAQKSRGVRPEAVRAAGSADSVALRFWRFTLREIGREAIWWLPLRLFVGIGWLRAFTEKAVNQGWHDGSSLAEFLTLHLPKAVFPGYAALMQSVFLPNAALFSWLVMIAQVCVGLALLFGWRTKPALIAGVFMNFNFVAAGEPNPSAFYLVIQMALLSGGAAQVFALDAVLKRRAPKNRAQRDMHMLELWLPSAAGVLLFVIAISSFGRIKDFSAAGSVKDPAAILSVLSFVGLGYLLIATLRAAYPAPRRSSRKTRITLLD